VLEPPALGVKEKEQDPEASAQLGAPGDPGPVFETATDPVGVLDVPGEMSETFTVQVLAWPIVPADGVHDTAVAVARFVTSTVPRKGYVPPTCFASPP
jgi:hypothetical protein